MADQPVKAPPGVTGAARAAFLALTPEQQAVYRYQFETCGRPAWLCLRVATTGST